MHRAPRNIQQLVPARTSVLLAILGATALTIGINACNTDLGRVAVLSDSLALDGPGTNEDTERFLVGPDTTVGSLEKYLQALYANVEQEVLEAREGVQGLPAPQLTSVLIDSLDAAEQVYQFEAILFLMKEFRHKDMRGSLVNFLEVRVVDAMEGFGVEDGEINPHDHGAVRALSLVVLAIHIIAAFAEAGDHLAEADLVRIACNHTLGTVRRRSIAELRQVATSDTLATLDECVRSQDRYQLQDPIAIGSAVDNAAISIGPEEADPPQVH